MVAWKVADSLLTLKGQLDVAAPLRSKKSDGFIGDAAHQSRDSDHNPWWLYGGQYYVTAFDVTHDPVNGIDGDRLASALVVAQDRRIKYVIWDRTIWDSRWVKAGGVNNPPWTALPYTGSDPHTGHVHISVLPIAESLTTTPWLLPGLIADASSALGVDELPSVDEVWAKPIDDPYTIKPGDNLAAGVALAWAAANAGFARDAAADAVTIAKRADAKLDRLIAKLGA